MSAQTPQTDAFIASQEAAEVSIWAALMNIQEHARTLEADRDHYKALCEELREALDHILWIKDCGIDGKNEKGEFVNWPADERNAMYEIAKAALKKAQKDI